MGKTKKAVEWLEAAIRLIREVNTEDEAILSLLSDAEECIAEAIDEIDGDNRPSAA